jgi:hypothetical protein
VQDKPNIIRFEQGRNNAAIIVFLGSCQGKTNARGMKTTLKSNVGLG